jgi:hypothetical protein
MARRKRKNTAERPVFDSIRKPVAPPTRKFDDDDREEKVHPSLRKTKHKRPPQLDQE